MKRLKDIRFDLEIEKDVDLEVYVEAKVISKGKPVKREYFLKYVDAEYPHKGIHIHLTDEKLEQYITFLQQLRK